MLYQLLIWAIITLKIVYVFNLLRDEGGFYKDQDNVKMHRETILFASELLMYLLLLIVFFPLIRGQVTVNVHEKHIFFILGIVGLIQIISHKLR